MHDYCQEMTRKGQHIPEMTLAFNRGAHLDARRYNEPLGLGVNEIAAVLFGNLDNNKDVKTRMLCVQLKHTGPESWRYLKVTDQNADPLTYPLFFPRGDSGWYEDMPLWHKSFPPDVIPPKPNQRAKKQTRQNRSAFIDDEAVDDDDAPQHQADEPQSKKVKRRTEFSMSDFYSYNLCFRPEEAVETNDGGEHLQPSPLWWQAISAVLCG